MSRTLLAATDFSVPARHALERAAQLAASHPGTRLMLAHVLSNSALDNLRRMLPGNGESLEADLRTQSQEALDELAAQLSASHACSIDARLLQGAALTVLSELAESESADLLVMGTRGAHFVRELLLGSTTERVLRKSRRPLLAVRQRPLSPYRRVLAPVDFSAHAAAAVNAAHAWLPDAEFVLLNAFEVELESTFRFAGLDEEQIYRYRIQAREAAQAGMDEFMAGLEVPASRLVRRFVHGPPSLRIIEQEQALDADLIVMGKHGQSVMEELLLGSVTRHVLAHSACDVFVAGHVA